MSAPGSALWLLKHELRLRWYNFGAGANKDKPRRGGTARTLITFTVLWLIIHAGAFAMLLKAPTLDGPVQPLVLLLVTAILVCLFTLMLSAGLKSSVEALFDRGDLDLLLSSPLPSLSIFTVRLLGLVASIALCYLFFLAPFAHAGLILGQFRWLAIYPTVLGLATLAATMGILLTLGLVRLIGARRTRVVAQVLGALAGALMFLMSQVFNMGAHDGRAPMTAWLAKWFHAIGTSPMDGAYWLPAKAALGEPGPLLAMCALGLGAFAFTVRFTHRFFVNGLQQAAGASRTAAPPKGGMRFRFGRGLAAVVVLKEWRLIARDPHLISQTLLQLLYLLPIFLLTFSKPDVRLAGIAAGMTVLSASLTSSLTWIIVQAEDTPDLLLVSPANPLLVRIAKLAAAVMPTLLLMAIPLLWLVAHQPLAGLLTCYTLVGAVIGAALITMWTGRPANRKMFATRAGKNFMGTVLDVLNTLGWAGLAFLLQESLGSAPSPAKLLGAGALFLMTLLLPMLAWLGRTRTATSGSRAG